MARCGRASTHDLATNGCFTAPQREIKGHAVSCERTRSTLSSRAALFPDRLGQVAQRRCLDPPWTGTFSLSVH